MTLEFEQNKTHLIDYFDRSKIVEASDKDISAEDLKKFGDLACEVFLQKYEYRKRMAAQATSAETPVAVTTPTLKLVKTGAANMKLSCTG